MILLFPKTGSYLSLAGYRWILEKTVII